MTILSDQLEAIFQEIRANFARHQQIQVTPIAGDPPEQYRITYHVQGFCKPEGSEIQTCPDHVIAITLPFGFPHFPPNCKPESPVFHPDFDQAAICIGEFWDEHQSLSKLILHIGRMVCGEIYSTENAFNEEAAAWYQENKQRLPLDTIQPFAAPGEIPLEYSEETSHLSHSEPLTLDIVDDAHFASNEIVALDDEDDSADDQTQVDFAQTVTKEAVSSRLSLQRSDATTQKLESRPNENHPNLKEAQQKHAEGEKYEHQGQPTRALERYEAVKNLIPDFPEIDKDISRAQYSVEMLGDWAAGDTLDEVADSGKKKTIVKPKEKKGEAPPPKPSSIQRETKSRSRWPVIIAGSGAAGVFIALIVAYFSFSGKLEHAETTFTECQQLLERDMFIDAEQKCAESLELTYKVLFIKQQEKNILAEKIKEIQGSKRLNEGLALNKAAADLPEWQKAMQLADKYFTDGQWKEAMASYTRTLQLASANPAIDKAIVDQIRNNSATAQFNIFLQAGEKAIAALELDSAKNHLDKAMALAKQNPQIPPETISRIKSLTSQIEFNALMAAGEGHFAKGEWNKALTAFEQAQEIEKPHSFADATTVTSLQEVIVRTKVFDSLEQGKKAFTEAQWDAAIASYEIALRLLEENSEILRRDNPLQSQQKIAKLMLHAAITRDQQSVATHLKAKEFSLAIDKLQAIIETVNKSPLAKEQEFQTIIKETRGSIAQAQEDLLMIDLNAYLTDNFQKIFTLNNPTLTAENLTQPKTAFVKKIDSKLLFKLQCFEQGHGRPVLLQISYIYDPATQKWRFYSNDKSVNEREEAATGQKILAGAYQAQEDRLIAKQIAYLNDNFQTLLVEDTPDLLAENLTKPQASFVKKIGDKMLFALQYLDQNGEKPTPRKISYLYDPATNKWELYPPAVPKTDN
jgi:tetratricopeptide (TPR) repeat protein